MRTGNPWSQGLGSEAGKGAAMSEERELRTWVKVNGVYPLGLMVEGASSRDRLVLHIPQTQGPREEVIPEHSVSIEMRPVLWAFRKFLDASDRGWVAEDMNERCGAELLREGRLIATCQMEKGHPHNHMEFGSTVAVDNWPPSFEWGYTGRTGPGLERMRATYSGKRIRWRLRLPGWDLFQSHRRNEDPLQRWLFWVAKELGGVPPGELLDPMRVFLCEQDYDRLIALERFWTERLTGEPSDSWLQQLQLAPAILGFGGRVPSWALPGWAYIAADAIRPSEGQPKSRP